MLCAILGYFAGITCALAVNIVAAIVISIALLFAVAFLFAILVLGVSVFVRTADVVFSPLIERLIVELRRPPAVLCEPSILAQDADNADELDSR